MEQNCLLVFCSKLLRRVLAVIKNRHFGSERIPMYRVFHHISGHLPRQIYLLSILIKKLGLGQTPLLPHWAKIPKQKHFLVALEERISRRYQYRTLSKQMMRNCTYWNACNNWIKWIRHLNKLNAIHATSSPMLAQNFFVDEILLRTCLQKEKHLKFKSHASKTYPSLSHHF